VLKDKVTRRLNIAYSTSLHVHRTHRENDITVAKLRWSRSSHIADFDTLRYYNAAAAAATTATNFGFYLTGLFAIKRSLQVKPSPGMYSKDWWCEIFYRPEALPVSQPTVLTH